MGTAATTNKCSKCGMPLTTTQWRQCEDCREDGRISSANYRKSHLEDVAAYSREYQPAWRRRQIEKDPDYLLREATKLRHNVFLRKLRKYNLTEDDYNKMAAKGCTICGGPPCGRGRYHFDHDHSTGKFRGLLCTKCNTGLGQFQDNQDLLIKAVGYLARFVV